MTANEFLSILLDDLQLAEEMEGIADPREYHRAMLELARECIKRAETCRKAHLQGGAS